MFLPHLLSFTRMNVHTNVVSLSLLSKQSFITLEQEDKVAARSINETYLCP